MKDPKRHGLTDIASSPIQNMVEYQVEDVIPHRRGSGAEHDQCSHVAYGVIEDPSEERRDNHNADELETLLARVTALREEYGVAHDPFEIHVISLDAYTHDGIRRLEDLGVSDVMIGFRNSYVMEQDSETLEQKVSALRNYSDRVISKSR